MSEKLEAELEIPLIEGAIRDTDEMYKVSQNDETADVASVNFNHTGRIPVKKRTIETSTEAKERIIARIEASRAEREALFQQYGDPVEGLSDILADIPSEIIEQNFERDENGLVYVKRFDL
ncbi:MAG: hypothetical protein HXX20_23735 [Chloroflexi bacterium]|nr:hypothetical protein [Chloroflexota bacterium]